MDQDSCIRVRLLAPSRTCTMLSAAVVQMQLDAPMHACRAGTGSTLQLSIDCIVSVELKLQQQA